MNHDQVSALDTIEEPFPYAARKVKRLGLCVFLVGVHSLTLGSFIFFFTDAFYTFFFGVKVDNPFLIKQAGLFLFCLGLFYLVPLTDMQNKHRVVDLIIVTKVLAVLFLVTSAKLVALPGPIFLAAAGDAIMGILLIFCSLKAGLLFKKAQRPQA
jgi:hypothetical protein